MGGDSLNRRDIPARLSLMVRATLGFFKGGDRSRKARFSLHFPGQIGHDRKIERQIIGVDRLRVAHHHQSLCEILQLPDVARPRIARQHVDRGAGKLLGWPSVRCCKTGEKVPSQVGYVLAATA